jgi:hypothetical protein
MLDGRTEQIFSSIEEIDEDANPEDVCEPPPRHTGSKCRKPTAHWGAQAVRLRRPLGKEE